MEPLAGNTNRSENHLSKSEKGIVGIFDKRKEAEEAYQIVHELGYEKGDVNLIMSEDAKSIHFRDNSFEGDPVFTEQDIINENEGMKRTNVVLKDAAIGAGIGATVGAVLGAIAAIGTSIVIPGAGLVVAGPIAAGLISATGLGLGGGMIGTIFGFEVPDNHTTIENELSQHKILLGIHPKSPEHTKLITSKWNDLPGSRVVTE